MLRRNGSARAPERQTTKRQTTRRGTRRRFGLVVPVLALMALASSCLIPSGTIRQITHYDTADPAAVPVLGDMAQIYTTNGGIPPFNFANVPSYMVNFKTGQSYNPFDALPTRPNWVKVNTYACQQWGDCSPFVWAPTVRFVNGRYLMMFTASRQVGQACIGMAWSTYPTQAFTPVETQWCDAGAGLLDPQIFVDTTGIWVHYSRQTSAGYSEIVAQRITTSGNTVSKSGAASTILTVNDARSVCGLRHPVNSCTVAPGPTPGGHVVENPAMVKDPHNSYNLLVSVGNWKDNSYRTVEVPCTAPNSGCTASFGAPIQTSGSGLGQAGGASLLYDNSPDNYMFFHAVPTGASNRRAHVQQTVGIKGN